VLLHDIDKCRYLSELDAWASNANDSRGCVSRLSVALVGRGGCGNLGCCFRAIGFSIAAHSDGREAVANTFVWYVFRTVFERRAVGLWATAHQARGWRNKLSDGQPTTTTGRPRNHLYGLPRPTLLPRCCNYRATQRCEKNASKRLTSKPSASHFGLMQRAATASQPLLRTKQREDTARRYRTAKLRSSCHRPQYQRSQPLRSHEFYKRELSALNRVLTMLLCC
jgi:hypothetical protein